MTRGGGDDGDDGGPMRARRRRAGHRHARSRTTPDPPRTPRAHPEDGRGSAPRRRSGAHEHVARAIARSYARAKRLWFIRCFASSLVRPDASASPVTLTACHGQEKNCELHPNPLGCAIRACECPVIASVPDSIHQPRSTAIARPGVPHGQEESLEEARQEGCQEEGRQEEEVSGSSASLLPLIPADGP